MYLHLVKMFLSIFCVAIAAQLIQGARQCSRTNKDPLRHCTDECIPVTGCRNSRKKCLCDGNCGYSCVYPNKRCSKPRTRIRNGRVIFKSFKFNDTQRAVCKPGYRLSGSAVRTCRGNAFWDGKQARCKIPQTNCKDPGTQGLLLRSTEARKSFKPGTKLRYYCPHKFTLRGLRNLVCRRDGTWSASLPRCIVPKCNQAVLPPHTQVIQPKNWKNRRDYGIRFALSCDYGYTFTTQRGTLVCDVPAWKLEPSTFKCFPKSCPDPGTPRNGNVKGLFRFGERVSYTCGKCYKLKGPAYRHCQADQTWTDSQPTCEPVTCSFLQNPTNGYLTSNSQRCDTTVQYHCDHGYHLNGSPRRRCQSDGTWSGKESICEVQSCQDPGTPWKGSKKGSFQVGQTLYFSCAPCYRLRGSSTRTCQPDLKWSGLQTTCQVIKCSRSLRPNNGRIVGDSILCGNHVQYTCNTGYNLKGSSKRYCKSNGKWTGTSPTCIAAVRTNPKTQVAFKPNKKFVTIPPIYSTTLSPTPTYKTFAGTNLKSKKQAATSSPTTTQFPKTTIALISPCGRPILPREARVRLQIGNILMIGCKPNYATVNFGRMRCNNNSWNWENLKDPICVAKGCADPGTPQNGHKQGLSYFIDDVVTFTCDSCYRLVGNSVRTCLKNGSWSNTQPLCVLRTCPSLNDTAEATTKFYSQACGAIATYKCKNKKLKMLGSGEKVCNESGRWIGAEPKCIDRNLNIALRKRAFMSSHWPKYGGKANLAVDGNRRGRFFHTNDEYGPWWKVDLLKVEPVSTVIVVNRRDCCTSRINGFKVSVGNNFKEAEKNTECGGRSKAVGGENIIHCPKPLRGRYVAVYLPKSRYSNMALFEVEVYRKRMEE